MKSEDLCVFLTGYTLVVAMGAVAALARKRSLMSLATTGLAFSAVALTTVVGFYVKPGTNYLALLGLLVRTGDFSALVSLGLGVAAALAWVVRLTEPAIPEPLPVGRLWLRQNWVQLLLCVSLLGVVACGESFIWKEVTGTERDPAVAALMPEFVVEKVAALDFFPLRLAAAANGTVYVSYDYFEAWGTMGGAILELKPDSASSLYQRKIIADSPFLMRSYGMTVRNGDIYVSRTGIAASATEGSVTYGNTGAVTRLRDTDGDGYFEHAHDVVTGLPGARGPDTMQQNNGIVFADDGTLFITTASAGNRTLDLHPWAGVILRTRADFTTTEIFAKGFRNPFGIAVGPEGELFATDNDIDENPGDELNHVVEGAHYGHPFVVPHEEGVSADGFQEPIHVGELESNFLGIAYATSEALPDEYRHALYMTDYMQNLVWQVQLERTGDTFKVREMRRFARITSPVDIVATNDGDFFVTSRRTQNVYRIRLKSKPRGSNPSLQDAR